MSRLQSLLAASEQFIDHQEKSRQSSLIKGFEEEDYQDEPRQEQSFPYKTGSGDSEEENDQVLEIADAQTVPISFNNLAQSRSQEQMHQPDIRVLTVSSDGKDQHVTEQIAQINERMQMNQMPDIGDLISTSKNRREIEKNISAFHALLNWKETKSQEIRQDYQNKLRKITFDRDSFEKKCQKLEE